MNSPDRRSAPTASELANARNHLSDVKVDLTTVSRSDLESMYLSESRRADEAERLAIFREASLVKIRRVAFEGLPSYEAYKRVLQIASQTLKVRCPI